MKKSRQHMRADERQRIKDIEKQNKTFNDKFKKQELHFSATKAILENEIIGLKKEVERLKKENKELSKGYQKQKETESEKQFIESFGKMLEKTQKDLAPEYNQFVNDNFHELLSE
jgi:predicted RNase H-like nuclease (RuvC/YqgF family)